MFPVEFSIRTVEVKVVEFVLTLVGILRDGHVVAVHVGEVGIGVFHTKNFLSLKENRSWFTDDFFVYNTLETIVIHAYIKVMLEVIGTKQATGESLCSVLSDDLAAEQRNPTRWTMPMAVRVPIGHVDDLLHHIVTDQVQTAQQEVVWHSVKGENIDIYAPEVG